MNRQEAAGWYGWWRTGIVVYFYLSGTTCLGSLNGNFASDRERTAGRIPSCESSCFRPTDTPLLRLLLFSIFSSLTFIFFQSGFFFTLFFFRVSAANVQRQSLLAIEARAPISAPRRIVTPPTSTSPPPISSSTTFRLFCFSFRRHLGQCLEGGHLIGRGL